MDYNINKDIPKIICMGTWNAVGINVKIEEIVEEITDTNERQRTKTNT